MAGIGKQLRGSGIARPGFSSKHEVTEKQEYRVGKAGGGKIGSFERGFSAFKNLDKSPSLGLNKLPKPVLAKMKDGGKTLKPVDKEKNPGLSKLPTKVRNKMGYMKKGGRAHYDGGGLTVKNPIQKMLEDYAKKPQDFQSKIKQAPYVRPIEVDEVLPGMKKGGRAHYAEGSKNWIKGAIKHPGSLRKSLHVKEGQKIPAAKLAAAAKKPGKLGRRARLAETLKGFKK